MLQTDAITAAAKARGLSVADWTLDCLLTYASNHLARGLGDWVVIEAQYIQRGDYPACGATKVMAEGTPVEHTAACLRIRGHRTEAVASQESHVGYMPDMTTFTSWDG
jgi:hypothetical protein